MYKEVNKSICWLARLSLYVITRNNVQIPIMIDIFEHILRILQNKNFTTKNKSLNL